LYSPVLRAAFNSTFIEGQSQTYTLEGCDKAFQLIVQWMYRQSITPPATKEESALIYAKKLSIHTIQDSKILLKMEQSRLDSELFVTYWIVFLYENVPRGAAIRELVLEQCFRFIPDNHYETSPERFPKEFLLDYVIREKRLQKKKQAELDPFKDRAEFKRRFHVPEEGMIA
jgi:hypothetical protein